MAQAIRNLQLFRNETVIVEHDITYIKEWISSAMNAETPSLVLSDGEPITIRFKQSTDKPVKSLNGVAHITESVKEVIWSDDSTITVLPTEFSDGVYVKLVKTDNGYGDEVITATAQIQSMSTADSTHKGLAEASDVKAYVDGKVITHPEYTIVEQETPESGYAKTYELKKDGESITGSTKINIPNGAVYTGGNDIDIVSETRGSVEGNYIDTALDDAITVAGLTTNVGAITNGYTFPQGTSLSDIIKAIFVKDVDVTGHIPSIKLTMTDGTITYEYGSSISKTLSVGTMTDGYFTPENSAYSTEKFNENNSTTGGKLNAGCSQGTTTYSCTSGTIDASTGAWSIDNATTNITLSSSTAYSASTVTAKTLANNNSSKTISAGSLSNSKTLNVYKKVYVGVISGIDFTSTSVDDIISAVNSSSEKYGNTWYTGNGYYVKDATSPIQTTSETTYDVPKTYSLMVFVPYGKTVTGTTSLGTSLSFSSASKTKVVSEHNVEYTAYWCANESSDAATKMKNIKVE